MHSIQTQESIILILTEYDEEQGVCVPYPDDDVNDATDQRLPPTSALLEKIKLISFSSEHTQPCHLGSPHPPSPGGRLATVLHCTKQK